MLTSNLISEKFKREVQKILYFNDNTIIVLFKFQMINPDSLNVICLDNKCNIKWVIFPDELWPNDYYVDIFISDSYLIASSVSTMRYTIDPQTGEKVSSSMTK